MAVIDHPVHSRTRESADARWGCWNRPEFSDGYWAPDRIYRADGTFDTILAFMPHVMSTECRNDISLSDQKCDGCMRRGSGEEYSFNVRTAAK